MPNSERLKHTQRHSRRSCFVIFAVGGMTNKWSEAGIQLKYASSVAGHNRGEAALLFSLHYLEFLFITLNFPFFSSILMNLFMFFFCYYSCILFSGFSAFSNRFNVMQLLSFG